MKEGDRTVSEEDELDIERYHKNLIADLEELYRQFKKAKSEE